MLLFWLSLALLAGIGLARYLYLPWQAWLGMAGAFLLMGLVSWWLRQHVLPRGRNSRWAWLAGFSKLKLPFLPPYSIMLLAFSLGAARYTWQHPPLDARQLAWYNDRALEWVVEGVLVSPADRRDSYTNLKVRVERIRPVELEKFIAVSGVLLAQVPPGEDWQYGDRLSLRGELLTPAAGDPFSYRDYLATQGVYSLMRSLETLRVGEPQLNPIMAALYRLQASGMALVNHLYPDPEASLVAGIVLGAEHGLPERVQSAFSISGTAHIVAISGFNITILAGILAAGSSKLLGRWRGAILAGLGITLYVALTGGQPSAVRAAWMGGLGLLAGQLGRRQDGLTSLGFVAAVMAWLDSNVLEDIGFQLSFTATLGLLLLGDSFTNWLKSTLEARLPQETAKRLAQPLVDYLLLTLAAQALSLPITILHFQRLSVAGLAANFFILPVQPLLMILGGLSVLLGWLFEPLGQIFAYLAWPFAHFTIQGAEFFARIPGAVLATGRISAVWVLCFYAFAVAVWLKGDVLKAHLARLQSFWKPGTALLLLLAVTALVWQSGRGQADSRLHLTLLDVSRSGQSGEAILLQTPGGRFILINGGPAASRLSDQLGQRLPLFNRRLDWLVVAGVDDPQLQAVPAVLARYPARQVLWAGNPAASPAARQLNAVLLDQGTPRQEALPGQSLDLGEGARLDVLTAGPRGMALLLSWRNFRMLLPLGLDAATLDEIGDGRSLGSLSALLLPGAGYAPLNPAQWALTLRPQLVLLSVSPKDWRGLPDPQTIAVWQGFPLVRTDHNGWIEVQTDGEQMWVEVERK